MESSAFTLKRVSAALASSRRMAAVALTVIGLAVGFLSSTSLQTAVAADPPPVDGMTVHVTPDSVLAGSGQSFTLTVLDSKATDSVFNKYWLTGLPANWVVRDGSTVLTPTSPDPVIYELNVANARAGRITITPPTSYSGTLNGVGVARSMTSPNLITDWDRGTFDFIGTSKPRLTGTSYTWSDPQRSESNPPECTSLQYGPCDGQYTVWPTAAMEGTTTHLRLYWADFRSLNNPMSTPTTSTICQGWNNPPPSGGGNGNSGNMTMVTEAQSSSSGKIAVFNGATPRMMSTPHDLLATTVTGLLPNHPYVFNGYVANLSYNWWKAEEPVRTAAYARTPGQNVNQGTLIGSTSPIPRQSTCLNSGLNWATNTGVVMTNGTGTLILSMRNYGTGGYGNDLAIDNLTLYPTAQVTFPLPVTSGNPAMRITKTSNPPNGSSVSPGQTITYTLRGENRGDTPLTMTLQDNLAGVMANATYGSATATIAGETGVPAPSYNAGNNRLSWTGNVPVGKEVVITYTVTVRSTLTGNGVLLNAVTGSAYTTGSPSQSAVSNCVNGTESGCFSRLTAGTAGMTLAKTSNIPSGTTVRAGEEIIYTITARNSGTLPLTNVSVFDDMTQVLNKATFVNGSITTTSGSAQLNASTRILTWTGDLAVGQTVTITYRVTVNSGATLSDRITNRISSNVTDNCDTNPNDPACSVVITPRVPGMTVAKSSTPASGSVTPGSIITYKLIVTNTGNVPLNPAVINDNLSTVLNNATYVAGSASSTVGSAPNVGATALTWSAPLAPGQVAELTYSVRVNNPLPAPATLVNRVTGFGTDTSGSPSVAVPSNCMTGTENGCFTTLNASQTDTPNLTVRKYSNVPTGSTVKPGDTITYTVRATNTGNVPLTNVVLSDDMNNVLNNTTYVPGSMSSTVAPTPTMGAGGWSWTGNLAVGSEVVIAYTVTVNQGIPASTVLVNKISSNTPGNCVPGSNDPDCTVIITPKIARLNVAKISSPASGNTVLPGSTITYFVTATNTGNVALTPVTVIDDLTDVLSNAQFVAASASRGSNPARVGNNLSWTGDLLPGQNVVLTYSVTVNSPITTATELKNKVTGSGLDRTDVPTGQVVPSNCVNGSESGCNTTLNVSPTPAPGVTLNKTSNVPSGTLVAPGRVITYTVTATNTGNTDLTNVIITDDLSGVLPLADFGTASARIGTTTVAEPNLSGTTLTWSGPLAIGQTLTITYTVTVKAGASVNDRIVNKISSNVPDNCDTNPNAPECTVIITPKVTRMSVAKAAQPSGTVAPGTLITYTLTAQNSGNVPLTPAVLTDDLSQVLNNASFVTGSITTTLGSTPTLSGNTLSWSGNLGVSQSVIITYQVRVNTPLPAPVQLVNGVKGHGFDTTDTPSPGDRVNSNCVLGTEQGCYTTVNASQTDAPGLTLNKTASVSGGEQVRPGDIITYTLTGVNTGNVPLIGMLVNDDLSGVLHLSDFVSGSARIGTTVVAPPVLNPPSLLTWTGDLAVGQTLTITYSVRVKTGATVNDTFVNSVAADVPNNCETDPTLPECQVIIIPNVPKLEIVKTSSPASGGTVSPGATINYTVVATNTGNVALSNVTITDDMTNVLSNATFGSATSSVAPNPARSGNTLVWVGNLAPGASVTINYSATVNSTIATATVLTNKVIGSGVDMTDPDNPGGNNVPSNCVLGTEAGCFSEVNVSPTPVPGVTLNKTASVDSGSIVAAGTEITYTVTATNTGNVPLTGVEVTDDMTQVLNKATWVSQPTPATGVVVDSSGWTWTGSLAVGETRTFVYTVKVNEGATITDEIKNRISSNVADNCDDDPTLPECEVIIIPKVTGMRVAKVSSPASGLTVNPGSTITYYVTATNTGNVPLTNVTVSDDLSGVLANAAFGTATASRGNAPTRTGDTLTWNGTIPAGQNVVLTYTVIVNSPLSSAVTLNNKVIGYGFDPSDTPAPGDRIDSNCVTGAEQNCNTTLEVNPTPAPGVTLNKSASVASGSTVRAGETITYTVRVTNTGNVALSSVVVSDDMSAVLDKATWVLQPTAVSGTMSVTDVGWSWTGDLTVGQVMTFTYSVRVSAGATVGDEIRNRISSSVPDNCDTNPSLPGCEVIIIPEVPGLTLNKSADVPANTKVAAGDDITYTVTARNTGNVPLSGVTVSDDMSDVLDNATMTVDPVARIAGALAATQPDISATGWTWTGDLAVGQTVTITYTVKVDAGAIVGDEIRNRITSDVPDNCDTNPSLPECEVIIIPEVPDLTIVKSSDIPTGTRVVADDVITYTVVAENTGNVPLTGVVVSDDMSDVLDNATWVSQPSATIGGVAASAPVVSGTSWTWSGNLAVGDVLTITYSVKVNAGATATDQIVNKVSSNVPGNCEEGSDDPECEVVIYPDVPGLQIKKVSDVASGTKVVPGDLINYTVTAKNVGNVPLSNVRLSDDMSDVLDNATMIIDPVATIAGAPAATQPVVSATGWTWTGALAVGQEVTITYRVRVEAGATVDDVIHNKVSSNIVDNCDTNPALPECEVIIIPEVPDLTIVKSSDVPTGTRVVAGDLITYTVVAENTGNVPLTGVVVSDDMRDVLDNATWVDQPSATIGGVAASVQPVVSPTGWTWTGGLAVGDVLTITYSVRVSAGATATDQIVNKVTANVPGNCEEDSDDPECEVVIIPDVPGITLVKTASVEAGTKVKVGETIEYQVTATNTGNTVLTGVTVSDDMSQVLDKATWVNQPSATRLPAPSVTATGWTWTGDLAIGQFVTITYSVKVSEGVTVTDVIRNKVSSDVPDNCDTNPNLPECDVIIIPEVPGLEIAKVSDPASGAKVKADQEVTYTVTAKNTGNVDLAASFTDDLSDILNGKATLVGTPSASIGSATISSTNVLTWAGTLEPGQTATIIYKVKVASGLVGADILVNKVQGSGETPDGDDVPSNCVDGDEDECSSTLTPADPGLHIVKTSDPASGSTVVEGQVINYTITAENTGNVPLSNISVADDLTGVLSRADFTGSPTARIGQGSVPAPVRNGNLLTWNGSLEPGQVLTVDYSVTVKADLRINDTIINKVTGFGQDPDGGNVPSPCVTGTEPGCSVILHPRVPALTLNKTSDPPSGSKVIAGQVISYTVTVVNTGNWDFPVINLTDDMSDVLDNTTFVAGSASARVDGNAVDDPVLTGTELTWTGPLAVGQTLVITYQVTVKAGATVNDTIVNRVISDVPSNCEEDPTLPECEVIIIPSVPDLALKKVSNPASGSKVKAGATITYTVTAKNTGNTDLDPVDIVDNMKDVLDNATLVAGSISATIDGQAAAAATLVGTDLKWTGRLNVGQTLTLTYKVKVKSDVTVQDVIKNAVSGVGTDIDNPDDDPVPGVCVDTTSTVCETTIGVKPGQAVSTGGIVVGSLAGLAGIVLMTLGGAVLLIRRKAMVAR